MYYLSAILSAWDTINPSKTLEGRSNVFFHEENCCFATCLLRQFHEYLKEVKGEDIDVVHCNAGLWDCLRLFEEDVHTPLYITIHRSAQRRLPISCFRTFCLSLA